PCARHQCVFDAAMAPAQESGLRENCTSRLSERAEAGRTLDLSRLYGYEAGEQSERAHCGGIYRGKRSGAGGAKGGGQGACAPAKARTGLRARLACHRRWSVYGKQLPSYTRGGSRMRESRSYGSVRGARDETRVPTATTPRVHHAAWRRGGVARAAA